MYRLILGKRTHYGYINVLIRTFDTNQEATDWGFANLPSKPTDDPWGVFDLDGKPVPPPCSAKTLDDLMKAWGSHDRS
jgi:hypothetical protein